jgi:putative nucleotidyltransferase with HDIG domain
MADVLIDGSPVRTQERAAGPKQDLDAPASVVNEYIVPAPGRHMAQMLLATTMVAVLPLVVSLALRASGLLSGWVSVGLAVVMSLGSSTAGSAYWRKRDGDSEVLFGELLLWGWIRSWRQERELANATRLLALVSTGPAEHDQRDELTVEQREQLLQQLAGALEGQDVYLNGHSRRVARHATMIARGMGLSSEEVARIRAAAAVHDVGKLHTPKAILNKPGRLTDAEFEVIKRHPVDGAAMVAALGDPELTRIVRHHHERLDGAGYPDRLRGEEIPVGARIIAVADTFDAITSARPYRDAAPHQKAIDILRKEAGTQLDPDAVRSFLAYYSGSRPTVVWAIITSSLRRIMSWLTGDPAAAATLSAGKVAATTAATAAIGVAAGAAPVPVLHHAPARPVVSHAHSVPARPRGTAIGSRPHAVSVLLPATSPPRGDAAKAAKASPAKPHRRHAHDARARRPHAQPSAGRLAHRRAARAGISSPSPAPAVTGVASGTAASPATPSSAETAGESTSTPEVNGAGSPRLSQPASPSQSAPPSSAPPSKPGRPAKPTPLAKPAPPTKPAPPAKPDPPSKPQPTAKPAPPSAPPALAKPTPPTKPAPPAPPTPAKPTPPPKPPTPAKPAPPAPPAPASPSGASAAVTPSASQPDAGSQDTGNDNGQDNGDHGHDHGHGRDG